MFKRVKTSPAQDIELDVREGADVDPTVPTPLDDDAPARGMLKSEDYTPIMTAQRALELHATQDGTPEPAPAFPDAGEPDTLSDDDFDDDEDDEDDDFEPAFSLVDRLLEETLCNIIDD